MFQYCSGPRLQTKGSQNEGNKVYTLLKTELRKGVSLSFVPLAFVTLNIAVENMGEPPTALVYGFDDPGRGSGNDYKTKSIECNI